jgi:hypothetical protein
MKGAGGNIDVHPGSLFHLHAENSKSLIFTFLSYSIQAFSQASMERRMEVGMLPIRLK